jgi:hypothetical protein
MKNKERQQFTLNKLNIVQQEGKNTTEWLVDNDELYNHTTNMSKSILKNKKRNKVVVVFDFDETLYHCKSIEDEKRTLFLTLDYIEPIGKRIKLFNILREKYPCYIITNRHPSLREKISILTKISIDNIYCRDYALSEEELKIVNTDKEAEGFFLYQMALKKEKSLLEIRDKHFPDIIFFFDDMAKQIMNTAHKPLYNIKICEPINSFIRFNLIKNQFVRKLKIFFNPSISISISGCNPDWVISEEEMNELNGVKKYC